MSKQFIITLITLVLIGGATALAVMFAKGYTFSSKEGKVVGTGILTITSLPDGASVYIDGHLATATNTTLSQMDPKKYKVKIVKEGFIPWEKEVEVKAGLVSEIKATLFPALPTLYPLTFNGVTNVALSADGMKLAFVVPLQQNFSSRQKGGIWVWTMGSAPMSLNRGAEPHQIVASASDIDFAKATLRWSPDSKQLLASFKNESGETSQRNFLLPIDRQTQLADLKDITPLLSSTLKDWDDDLKSRDEARILAISDLQTRKIASESATALWSPDETRLIAGGAKIVQPTGQKVANNQNPTVAPLKGYKVYDVLTKKSYDLPEAKSYQWLPDSQHVILVQEDKIAVSEFDGNNVAEVYAGKFEDDWIFPWPDSSRIVLVTSFNTPTASQPNLFGINLK